MIVEKVYPDYHLLIPLILTTLPILTSLGMPKIMDNFGRKTLLQVGTFLMFFAHLLLAAGFYLNDSEVEEIK